MSESSYIAAQNINTADDAVRSLTGALNPAQEGMLGLGPAVDGVGDALGDASGEADGFSESLNALEANLNLDSAIEKMIEQLEFAAAGGLELQNQLNAAIQAYNDPQNVRYGDDVWLNQVLAAAFVEAQELQVELGNITADEAAQNIANTLNISLSEARNLMNGIVDGLNNLNGQEFSAEFSIFVSGLSNLREAWRLLGLVGGAGGGGGSVGGGILFDQVGGPVGAGQLAFVGEAGREIFIPQGATSGTGDDIILIGEDGPTLFIPEKSGHILSNSETEAILRGDRTIPKYEHGGPVGAGQLAIVGERGPELFVPNQSGTVISNEQLAGLGQHNTFIINDAMAAALILADQDIMRRDRFNNRMGI